MSARIHDEDAAGIRSQAHTLRGSAGTVAADGLYALVTAIEHASTAGQLHQCGELLPQVVEEFERFKSTLQRAGWA